MVQLLSGQDRRRHGQSERGRPERMEPERVLDLAACDGVPGSGHAAGGTGSTCDSAKRAEGRAVLGQAAWQQHRGANCQADRLPVGQVVRLSGSPFESGTLPSAIRMMSISVQMPHKPSVISLRTPSVV